MSSTPGDGPAARRPRRALSVVIAALCLIAATVLGGYAGWHTLGRQVTAEARLVVGQQTIQAQSVPGYALATQQLAATYSRLVGGDAMATVAPAGVVLSASPVPDSAIIRVQAVGADAAQVTAAADAAATALVDAVGKARGEQEADTGELTAARTALRAAQASLAQETNGEGDPKKVGRLQDAVAVAQLRVEALSQSFKEQVMASRSGSAGLTLTQQAAVTSAWSPRGVLVGAFGGALVMLLILGAVAIARRRGQR